MRKLIRVLLLGSGLLIILIVLAIVVLYYVLAPVKVDKLQIGDELLQKDEFVYVQKKDQYERGDVVLIVDCKKNEQTGIYLPVCLPDQEEQRTALIDGLPEEKIDFVKEFPDAYKEFVRKNENGSGFVSGLSLQENQYMIRTPITKKIALPREVTFPEHIYGKIISIPSRNWKEKWIFFKERTFYIPKFIREKLLKL